jgi:tripeptidyl-peptidase-1
LLPRRGFSVTSINVTDFANGRIIAVAGTSAAPPAIGAIITLINDARLVVGKSPVGFINPRYIQPTSQRPSTMPCAGITQDVRQIRSQLSGLDTPNFEKLLNLWMGLP